METKEHVIQFLFEPMTGTCDKSRDVIGIVKIWLRDAHPHLWGNLPRDGFGALGGSLEARHGEMGKERHHEQIVDAKTGQVLNRLVDRWILIAHPQFNRNMHALLQGRPNFAAADNER